MLAAPTLAKGPGNGLGFTFFPKSNTVRFSEYYPRSIYLELGLGAGAWYQSDQRNMVGQQLPLFGFVEVSKDLSPLSYGISYNTYTSFQQGDFTLSPDYASIYGRYSLSKAFRFIPPALDAYVMAGVSGWRAQLSDNREPGFQSAQQIQYDTGVGWMAGSGVRYYFGNLGIGAQWNYFNAQGRYTVTDGDSPVQVETGSSQVQITLSYRFRLGDPIKCPTFR